MSRNSKKEAAAGLGENPAKAGSLRESASAAANSIKNTSAPAAVGTEQKLSAAAGADSSAGIVEPAQTYFYKSQRDWIKDQAVLTICEKGRQEGFSYAHSYKVTRRAAKKNAKDEWIVSRDEVQAKQFILYCKRWAKVLNYAAEDHGEQVLMSEDGKSFQVQVLKFASGACIYALSSNPDAIVGKTGHVTLDEFALHKDQRTLYAVAKPVTTWGGTLSIISTHRGVGTVFNQIVRDIKERGNPMGWSLHTVPVQKAVEEGLVEKIDAASGGALTQRYLAAEKTGGPGVPAPSLREWWVAQQRAECLDEEQWLQEYCCVPADESTAFISYEMIEGVTERGLKVMTTAAEVVSHVVKSNVGLVAMHATPDVLYLGVDVARKTDLCVFDLGQKMGDVVWDLCRVELLGKTFAEIREELYRLLSLPQVKRCCIDATGLGMQLAEEAKERFGWKVEPVTFTGPVKEELAFSLRAAFEDRRLRVPYDEKLRADLRGIKKEVTAAGNIRFAGESADSHCDRFWAKALRQMAAGNKVKIGSVVI